MSLQLQSNLFGRGIPELFSKMLMLFLLQAVWIPVEGGLNNMQGSTSSFVTQNELRQRNCTLVRGLHANLIRFITKEGFHRYRESYISIILSESNNV